MDQTPAEMKQKNISFQSRRFMDANPRFAQAMGVTGLARAAFPANQKTDGTRELFSGWRFSEVARSPVANSKPVLCVNRCPIGFLARPTAERRRRRCDRLSFRGTRG